MKLKELQKVGTKRVLIIVNLTKEINNINKIDKIANIKCFEKKK